jgi:hypothetical protein
MLSYDQTVLKFYFSLARCTLWPVFTLSSGGSSMGRPGPEERSGWLCARGSRWSRRRGCSQKPSGAGADWPGPDHPLAKLSRRRKEGREGNACSNSKLYLACDTVDCRSDCVADSERAASFLLRPHLRTLRLWVNPKPTPHIYYMNWGTGSGLTRRLSVLRCGLWKNYQTGSS